jgi:heat-inducible transcriptional repressor
MMNAARNLFINPDRNLALLTDRQQRVLRLIVQEYVSSGRPVGSKLLAERYSIGYSSATIRNEMAELEAAGFVDHLHTSGGRIPTNAGYRYFVGNLMDEVDLPPGDQIMIRHQFRQAESQLEDWPDLAASVLAHIAGNLAVVTSPRAQISRIRHLELISLQPKLALLILVTFEGTVRQLMLHLPVAANQAVLSKVADRLARDLHGLSSDQIAHLAPGNSAIIRTVVEHAASALKAVDSAGQLSIRSKGIENIVGRPDVSEGDVQAVLELVHGGSFLNAILPQIQGGQSVQVFIGQEQLPVSLGRFGVIVAAYGDGNEVRGLLGVVGPTRMTYWKSISTVRYMSRLISDLVADLYPTVG